MRQAWALASVETTQMGGMALHTFPARAGRWRREGETSLLGDSPGMLGGARRAGKGGRTRGIVC